MTQKPGVFFSTLVSSPASLQAARALAEAGMLSAYYTPGSFKPHGPVVNAARLVDRLIGSHLTSQVMRRCAEGLPDHVVRGFSSSETARTVLSRMGMPQRRLAGLAQTRLERFERKAAQNGRGSPVIYSDRGSALKSLAQARETGQYSIYSVGGLGLDFYRSVEQAEVAKFRHFGVHAETDTPAWKDRYRKCAAELDLADLIIFNSRLTRDSHLAGAAQPGRVVPLGFPEINHSPLPPVDSTRPLRILWAGNFSLMKGAPYFLEALALLAQKSVPAEARVFGKQLLPAGILSAFHVRPLIRPTIPRDQLMAEYRRADVLVMPTLSDGFGMVISEAMSQGLPVITTPRAGAAEFIEPGVNGLIAPPADTAALADALAWCAGHRDELRGMGEAAKATAEAWQWSDYRKALAEVIVSTLQAERGAKHV